MSEQQRNADLLRRILAPRHLLILLVTAGFLLLTKTSVESVRCR